MAERIVPFSQLSAEDLSKFNRFNWTLHTRNERQIDDWAEVIDSRYGALRHVAVIDDERGSVSDKIDLDWSPAAFVVVYRKKDERIEFLLPTERRVLLKDERGNQGNAFIRNIPQGLIRTWEGETPIEAAIRETKEEVGIEPKNVLEMRQLYFDAANSQTAMPFFLAEVDEGKLQTYQQSLDPGEEIKVSEVDWFAIEDIEALKIQCSKTLSGLMLATGFLGIWPKNK